MKRIGPDLSRSVLLDFGRAIRSGRAVGLDFSFPPLLDFDSFRVDLARSARLTRLRRLVLMCWRLWWLALCGEAGEAKETCAGVLAVMVGGFVWRGWRG